MRKIAFFLVALALPVYGAVSVSNHLNAVRVFPNPWRADRHPNNLITFDGMPAASTVKLFTVSGRAIKTLTADSNGSASWDRKNSDGDRVASGVYLYLITDASGREAKGKLALIQ